MFTQEAELFANKKLVATMRVNRDGEIITRWTAIGSNVHQMMTTQKAYRIYGRS